MHKICTATNCDQKIRVSEPELCLKHYYIFKRYGDAEMLQKSVEYDERAKKYVAQVTFNGRLVLFDTFKTLKEAENSVKTTILHCNKTYFRK